jgi:hypothetical protein
MRMSFTRSPCVGSVLWVAAMMTTSWDQSRIHSGFVEDSGVALVEFEDGLVPGATASEDRGAVVDMDVEDHH